MENLDIIKKSVENLLKIIGFESEITTDYRQSEECILVNIQTDQINSGYLIGQGGSNLDSFQHLARLLVNKQIGGQAKFIIDVNNYKKHRIDLLNAIADDIAKQVLSERSSLALRPMPAYERRIIHLALSNHPLIDTESVGNEPERRVVVKIKPDI
ncbi:protein jag [Patescibacteria group bacterium]